MLEWPELPVRLSAFLETLAARRVTLLAGGGGFADVVRRLDRVHGLGEATAHTLALRSLELSARVLESILPGLSVVDRLESVPVSWAAGLTPIVSPRLIMENEDRRAADPLPATWSTTTDSIAARLATLLGATELILLKSTVPPGPLDRRLAARIGLVDPVFPWASSGLPRVSVVNLRADPWERKVVS